MIQKSGRMRTTDKRIIPGIMSQSGPRMDGKQIIQNNEPVGETNGWQANHSRVFPCVGARAHGPHGPRAHGPYGPPCHDFHVHRPCLVKHFLNQRRGCKKSIRHVQTSDILKEISGSRGLMQFLKAFQGSFLLIVF